MSDAPLYLSRARLRHDVPAAALRHLLLCDDPSERVSATHRLIWTLFADDPTRERDFLWREAEPGLFYLLSARPPVDAHRLFQLDPPKPFAPALAPGDGLAFSLRVNATVSRQVATDGASGGEGRGRGERCDIVMDALRAVPTEERAGARRALLDEVAGAWMQRQGLTHGFTLDARAADDGEDEDGGDDRPTRGALLRVTGYRVLRIARGRRAGRLQLGVLDLEGVLTVRDPQALLAAIRQGIGRAKAFGCGLLLVRRAR